ncbi:MAG: hypothetical protein GX359_02080 [Clostridiales bacterium]|nr:hypothetical protein [Clostridiales bacterium]
MKKKRLIISGLILTIAITALLFTKEIYNANASNSIRLNDKSVELEIGRYKTLRVLGTSRKATFHSSNPKVATVSSGGRVTAKASGTTTITASVAGKKLKAKVSVYQIYKKELILAPGNTFESKVWGPVRKAEWSSDNTSIVSVSDQGKITAKKPGNATIKVVVNGSKKLTSNVTVVGLDHESVVLEHGDWYGHLKTIKVEGTNKKITWETSDKSVAVVSSKGRVEAKGPGTAIITATVGNAKLHYRVKVLEASVKEFSLRKGETKKLQVFGTTSDITWHSNKKSVATVSDNGTVKAVGEGDAIIMIYVDGRRINVRVTVGDKSNNSGIRLNHNSVVLEHGDWYGHLKTLKVMGTDEKVTWETSDKSVAEVSSNGRVEAKGPGSAIITATVGNRKLTCEVKVLQVNAKKFTLENGKTKQLKVSGTTSDITWHSNKKSVVTVSDNGTVKAVGKGNAIIMIYVDGRRINARVTVK